MRALMVKKNHDYGDDNITSLGAKGVYVRMHDKMCRLKMLLWEARDPKVQDESVQDTLNDLACYAIIAMIELRGKWK